MQSKLTKTQKWEDKEHLTWYGKRIDSKLIEDFLCHAESEGCYKKSTLDSYRCYIIKFALLAREVFGPNNEKTIDNTILNVSPAVVRICIQKLRKQWSSKNTTHSAVSAVRAFFKWLAECGLVAANPIEWLEKKARDTSPLFAPKRSKLRSLVQKSYLAKEEAVVEWLRFIKRFAPGTQREYERVIRTFLVYMPANIAKLNVKHINDFLNWQLQKYKNRTVNTYLAVIKSFCRWLSEEHGMSSPASKIKTISEEPPHQRVLSPKEYKLVLSVCRTQDERDTIQFLANTGLRISEFRSLTKENISEDGRCLTITGKAKKRRVVTINRVVREIIDRADKNGDIYLFDRFHKRNSFYYLCTRLARDCCIDRFGPHSLRHYFCSRMVKAGVPLAIVSKILGHANIKTTIDVYTHILPDDTIGATDILAREEK